MAAIKQPMKPGVSSIGQIGTRGAGLGQIQAQKNYGINFIPYESIVPNKKNDRYDQIDLESLSYSIEDNGLFHNLVVTTTDENGIYRLVSGERRWRAIGLLASRNPERYQELFPSGLIPAKVQSLDDVEEEIALIVANKEVRNIDVADQLSDIQRLTELYSSKLETGSKTAISEIIAKQLGKSERQIRKYMSLDKLVPELMQAFENKTISIETAGKIASLGETEQLYLVDVLNEAGKIAEDDIDTAKLLQAQKEQAQKDIETKTNEIEILESMKSSAKTKEETDFIETKIASRQQDIAVAQQSLSRKELTQIRKITKATKAVDQMIESINKLQNVWEYAKNDSTITLKLEMLQMKLDKLKG